MKPIVVIAIVMLSLAVFGHLPYGFYQLLRIVVFIAATAMSIKASQNPGVKWAYTFGAIAILFNPIVPIHLERKIWQILDFASAGVLFVGIRQC